jgi:hypothetical protein
MHGTAEVGGAAEAAHDFVDIAVVGDGGGGGKGLRLKAEVNESPERTNMDLPVSI